MNTKQILAVVLILISLTFPSIVIARNLLNRPQMIVIDAKRNRLLVSNEANGVLVQIDSLGNQDYFDSTFVAGFIDGMTIAGDTIYGIGNARKLYGYNLETHQRVMYKQFPGNTNYHLSSVISDSAGHLFISSPPLHEIYKLRISDSTYQVYANAIDSLVWPNGMLLEREKNRIVVIGDAPSNSKIFSVSLSDSVVRVLKKTTLSSPDGIIKDKFGTYYLGGYSLPGLMTIDSAFTQSPTLFYQGPYPHIIYPTYDPSNHSILVTYYGNKAWERIFIDTGINHQQEIQKGSYLYPNYPNPFNPETTISFKLDKQSSVYLQIYDVKGSLVKTLLNGRMEAGLHSVKWDSKNQSDCQVASGVYYFCLKSDGISQIRKGILIK